MAPALLSVDEVAAKVRYSISQIYRKVRDETFPAPIRLGANRVAWPEPEIDAWINARLAERDSTRAA